MISEWPRVNIAFEPECSVQIASANANVIKFRCKQSNSFYEVFDSTTIECLFNNLKTDFIIRIRDRVKLLAMRK